MALTTGSSGNFSFSGGFTIQKSLGSGFNNSPINAAFPSFSQAFALGTGANAFNMIYAGTRSVTSGTPDDVDLTSLTSPDGQTIAIADVVGVWIRNQSGNTGTLTVGDAAANAWSACLGATGTVTLPPGGQLIIFNNVAATGYTVDSTHKLLRLAMGSGTSQAVDVMVFGH